MCIRVGARRVSLSRMLRCTGRFAITAGGSSASATTTIWADHEPPDDGNHMPRVRPLPPRFDDDGELVVSIPALREARFSQSLERGLAILACFTPERPVLGISELAEELGMNSSTTHRYASTLVALGYLEQGARRKYRLGLGVCGLGLSAQSSTSLAEHARPYLEELGGRTFHTVAIAVLDGPEILYVDYLPARRRGSQLVDLGLGVGSRQPAYCTAIGKLLMAHLPEGEQRRLITECKLGRCGPGAITSKGALRGELQGILVNGLAVAEEELAPCLYAIAAPVRCESREVRAAVSMAAHSSTISLGQLVEHLGPHLIATADRVSARLGYRREDERHGSLSGSYPGNYTQPRGA
jgi:IclR family transcriptional regulator, pca regulon regulatory protein